MKKSFFFTSESVTEGHPDRLCDTISDAIVDRFLQQDPYSRIVTECALSKEVVFLAARFASNATVDLPDVARSVISKVGYREEDFDAADCTVVTSLITMPSDQRIQVDEKNLTDKAIESLTVKNQVTSFGFACIQTGDLMPLPITLANRLARSIAAARREYTLDYLSPDCTTQVGIDYDKGKPCHIHSVTVIAGHQGKEPVSPTEIRRDLMAYAIKPAFAGEGLQPDENTEIFINPRGAFPKSGPASHSGMTGRKTAADTYGGYARHSGSALSGKDPTRIDRIASYAARYAAKNVVAAALAEECEIQLSYTIGLAQPLSIQVQTFGTGTIAEERIKKLIEQNFDFRLGAIIRDFNLRHLPTMHRDGFYAKLPVQGHLGNSALELPWERTDKSGLLRRPS